MTNATHDSRELTNEVVIACCDILQLLPELAGSISATLSRQVAILLVEIVQVMVVTMNLLLQILSKILEIEVKILDLCTTISHLQFFERQP